MWEDKKLLTEKTDSDFTPFLSPVDDEQVESELNNFMQNLTFTSHAGARGGERMNKKYENPPHSLSRMQIPRCA